MRSFGDLILCGRCHSFLSELLTWPLTIGGRKIEDLHQFQTECILFSLTSFEFKLRREVLKTFTFLFERQSVEQYSLKKRDFPNKTLIHNLINTMSSSPVQHMVQAALSFLDMVSFLCIIS